MTNNNAAIAAMISDVENAHLNQFSERATAASNQKTLDLLRELGGGKVTDENTFTTHAGNQVLRPQSMSIKQLAKLAAAEAKSQEEIHSFNHTFNYRPWDGANALQETLKAVFGMAGQGKTIHSFFGSNPPQYRTIKTGHNTTTEIPWGAIDFPPLEGTFNLGATMDPNYGMLFHVTVDAPKKFDKEIRGLWTAVEDYLKSNSIYKGKAIYGVGKVTREGIEEPDFLDAFATDPAKVAYRKEVFEALNLSVWGPIKTAQAHRDNGLQVNNKTLLYGPYGTGKSLAGGLTARVAVEEGWTFIQAKTGDEDLAKVMKTAELYAPAVVFLEDIDTLMESDPKAVARLLEMFDGVSSKNKEVMVLMTSNHIDSLNKGMTRVGRIDSAIEIGDLDREGIERLITANFTADQLAEDIDFGAICDAMEGFEPAFIHGTFKRAKSAAVTRTGSGLFVLTTDDFKIAAETLRNQHDTHRKAKHRSDVLTAEQVIGNIVRGQLVQASVDLQGGTGEIRISDES